jgi:hypothetical protein
MAGPSRHPDRSGSVRASKTGAPTRLSLGTSFGMSMTLGRGYSMVDTLVEFEDNRRIAWQARRPGKSIAAPFPCSLRRI